MLSLCLFCFFFQAEDGIRDGRVTGVQTCALPISSGARVSLIKQKMKETRAPLAGEMSGHMFFGGDWYGFDDALFAAARLLRYVADQGGPLSRLLADLPVTVATPELRVDCADDRTFEIVQRAAKHFASKYPVSTLDGVRITFAQGWGLLRASNTQQSPSLREGDADA